jgi:DeoR/GlpR family transcriptional regulator of sugar metabolism
MKNVSPYPVNDQLMSKGDSILCEAIIKFLTARAARKPIQIPKLRDGINDHFKRNISVKKIDSVLRVLSPLVMRKDDGVWISGASPKPRKARSSKSRNGTSPRAKLKSRNPSFFEARNATSRKEKAAVAIHIHERLLNRLDPVFLDGGSACEAVSMEMACGSKGHFTVMTNNMRAVRTLRTNETIRINVTGGSYLVDDEALVGKGAIVNFTDYSFRFAIVGASGLTATHVYNHGLVGEEDVKRAYWQIPASVLIVPATLEKLNLRDISCFGELYRRSAPEPANAMRKKSMYDWSNEESERVRKEFGEQRSPTVTHGVEKFAADSCLIVIEPTWMIDDNPAYKDNPRRRRELLGVVEEINRHSNFSHVQVVHANVTRKQVAATERRFKGI